MSSKKKRKWKNTVSNNEHLDYIKMLFQMKKKNVRYYKRQYTGNKNNVKVIKWKDLNEHVRSTATGLSVKKK